jgi:hypothetical protein
VSNGNPKPIRLSQHARSYLMRRGFSEAEVVEAIRLGRWQPTQHGRWESSREFAYNSDWNGTYYTSKRVRPIFVEEVTEIVVVTVYTYFF